MKPHYFPLAVAGLLVLCAMPVNAQDFRGRINGVVTDNTGASSPVPPSRHRAPR